MKPVRELSVLETDRYRAHNAVATLAGPAATDFGREQHEPPTTVGTLPDDRHRAQRAAALGCGNAAPERPGPRACSPSGGRGLGKFRKRRGWCAIVTPGLSAAVVRLDRTASNMVPIIEKCRHFRGDKFFSESPHIAGPL